MLRKFTACAAAMLAGAFVTSPAPAQQITAQLVANGFTNPLFVTAPPGDTSRLFVVEQRGNPTASSARIMILDLTTNPPTKLATPFLTITGVSTGNEQGLLGLAFHPDYAKNGTFFIYYTTSTMDNIARYKVSAGNPNVADPASATPILSWTDPESNHNGGWMAFGPDGYLYASCGDGGGGGDAHSSGACPNGNGQCTNTLLGKILRLSVSDTGTYTVPPTNPFAGAAPPFNAVWAYGLRNPFRCSFDRQTGELWIGDVGQDLIEEIDYQPADVNGSMGGRNYGWRCWEGNNTYNQSNCGPSSNMIFPVTTYSHSLGRNCVIGGYVYRGSAIPSLQGHYFFGDDGTKVIYSFQYTGSSNPTVVDRTSQVGIGSGVSITSFGEDASGEMYIVYRNGYIYKIVPPPPGNDNCSNANLVLDGSNSFTTVNATTDGPDDGSNCGFSGAGQITNDIWYKYLASCTGTATISLCGANFDTRIAVYSASCPTGPGQVIACNDDFCGTSSQVSFPVTSGSTYRVRIGSSNGTMGTGTMMISCGTPPSCPADINGDAQVNVADMLAVINAWGVCSGCPADTNHDNQVNVADLLAVINAWGPCQ